MEQYRKSPRARFLDYDGGAYFVTICTKGMAHYFGRISNDVMHLTEIGKYVDKMLRSARTYCSDVDVPLHVVMPNHIHMVVFIRGEIPLSDADN